ncbi:1-deoxy-D-xylulose-5-phosphate synthase 2 [Gossypium arboreum]|uniref:1-deoxy-D-xylulose-5-phosphate synthase 2 n=1 Tax=Gossypium arboreum TaxID=29729 RepID=A0A0B0P199_GOSAR|nr:1-deoxy-D-xylulose-5-phosphate synthase 2 [Gossypium arboreum]
MVLHENTYRILFHDICILTIPMVRTGLFGRQNTVNTLLDISYSIQ